MARESDDTMFEDVLRDVLPAIDKKLATRQVLVGLRPLHAAVQFCREFILEIRLDGREWVPDLDNLDFITENWFRGVYQLTEQWYERRYAEALETKAPRHAVAFVLAYGIPLRVDVPLSRITPGDRPKTVWLSIPDTILPDEEPLNWISSPPNLVEMDRKEKERLLRDLEEVCGLLRSISAHKMGIGGLTAEGRGFVLAARGHLDTAARQVLEYWQEKGTAKAAWELQIAVESALKAVAETKTGRFRATHDLFLLFDDAAPYLNHFSRNEIGKLPRWKAMINHRYAQGISPRLDEVFGYYRSALRIVDGCFRGLASLILGKGSFRIGLPPWRMPIDVAQPDKRSLGAEGDASNAGRAEPDLKDEGL